MRGEDNPEAQFFLESDQFALNEEQVKEKYAYHKDVVKKIRQLGLGTRPIPKFAEVHETIYHGVRAGDYFDGRLPIVLKQLSMDQLSALLSLFANWYGYLSQELGMVAAERSEAKRQKEAAWSMVRMSHHKAAKRLGLSFTDQKLSDMVRFDSRFVDYSSRFEELDVLYHMLQGILDVADSDKKVISREITIREAQMETEARGRGLGGAPSRFVAEPRVGDGRGFGSRGRVDYDEEDKDSEDDDAEDRPSKAPKKVMRRVGTSGVALRINKGVGKK
jgi:hypothetical protein